MKTFIVIQILLIQLIQASNYDLAVTRKESNKYKVYGKEILILTKSCMELALNSDVVLHMDGFKGKLFFLDNNTGCDVKEVLGPSGTQPGDYSVTVYREDYNWYSIQSKDMFIQTSMCMNLALNEDSILRINVGGSGEIYFVDDKESCTVEGVYQRLKL